MSKILLLNSGGLDTAFLAKFTTDTANEVHSLHLNLNVENSEVASVAATTLAADFNCTSHVELALDLNPIAVLHSEGTSVPGIAKIILSVGQSYARSLGEVDLVRASYRCDKEEGYAPLWNALDSLDRMSFPHPRVPIELPFWNLASYEEIMAFMGITDASEYAYTVSCSHVPPDGTCHKCVKRAALGLT